MVLVPREAVEEYKTECARYDASKESLDHTLLDEVKVISKRSQASYLEAQICKALGKEEGLQKDYFTHLQRMYGDVPSSSIHPLLHKAMVKYLE